MAVQQSERSKAPDITPQNHKRFEVAGVRRAPHGHFQKPYTAAGKPRKPIPKDPVGSQRGVSQVHLHPALRQPRAEVYHMASGTPPGGLQDVQHPH